MAIPDHVLALMWEYDPAWFSQAEGIPDALIERVMIRGGLWEMQWLLASVERTRLRAYLGGRGHRVLPPRELRFWSWIAEVRGREADLWVREARDREASWKS
jgi:hypothetical protein